MGEVILEGIEYWRIIALNDIAHIQLIYLHPERHLGPERVDVAVEEYLPSWRLVGRQRGAFWDFQKLVSLGDEIVSETDMTIEKISDFLDRCEAVVTAAISASSTTSRCLSGGSGGVVVAGLDDLLHTVVFGKFLECPFQNVGMGIALPGEHIAHSHHIVIVFVWLINNLVVV